MYLSCNTLLHHEEEEGTEQETLIERAGAVQMSSLLLSASLPPTSPPPKKCVHKIRCLYLTSPPVQNTNVQTDRCFAQSRRSIPT